MQASSRRIYFDTNVFLAFVGNEEGRADTVQTLLDEGRRAEIEVVTSVLSIAEVAFAAFEKDQGLSTEAEEAIDQLWIPASPVTLIDVSQVVSRRARSIIRGAIEQDVGRIAGADAVHLATAMLFDCAEIFTYEEPSIRARWNAVTGIAVSEPATNAPQLDL